ncbi:divergent polysaccharide deacetylase family protein [Colwellia echini]|uniref:Divergent polysaccharide deacetylase family protein n=1 Tax=Colwellia echini TaxID=1982103 RepID=A0ABY3MXV6_9GAMM|nr:divergent polysaccharide deacetylase family protein [Colwellia echini]TYK66051.1 divergent polysaccharide deacetylase family protein [Colwellia echini]
MAKANQIAIVIDDMGYRDSDKQALTLPGNITYAVLPHTTYGKTLAEQANKENHDVLIHIPMESENNKKLGPGALTSDMNKQDINQSLAKSFAEIPFAIGINNHMGSYLTQLYQPMAWTMAFLKQNNLLFLDSKTSAKSQAGQAALDLGVPVKTRQIFLDNELTEAYLTQQFTQLISLAQQHQSAIAIAHPHPETIVMLHRLIPTLASHNIELVPLSSLYSITAKHPEITNKSAKVIPNIAVVQPK